jgi:hypothetical protein
LHRRDDPWIRTAPADVSAHALAHVVVFRTARLTEECDGRHDLTRCAIAALKAVVVDEGLLDGVQFVAAREPFDGGDGFPLSRGRQRQARQHATVLDVDRARAALAVVASLLGPCQMKVLANGIEERNSRIE